MCGVSLTELPGPTMTAKAAYELRYNQKAGDPTSLTDYLKHEEYNAGIIARYVGNRVHILFHMSGIICHILDILRAFLSKFTSSDRLGKAILVPQEPPT